MEMKLPDEIDRIVPPTGRTGELTIFVSGAMAYLAVFALAFHFTAGRVSDNWTSGLANTATLRISAPSAQLPAQTSAALQILEQTPGVTGARALSDAEQAALLAPWLGAELPLDDLSLPRLIELKTASPDFDGEGLRLRLRAEVPGAVLDDHGRWRKPVIEAASRLQTIGVLSIVLIALSLTAMVTLATTASLSANSQVISVLRLIGARDSFVARAFTRRFTMRALAGATVGAVLGMASVALLPSGEDGVFGTTLGFRGAEWFASIAIPVVAGMAAFWATRIAAIRRLRETK